MQKTNISWATHTWNPITGCSPCSPGCENCYAKDLHDKRHKAYLAGKKVPACYAQPFDKITFHPERLDEPMRLRKHATIFVCSMGDLGHPDVEDEWIDKILHAAESAPRHTFMALTKRPERMREYLQKRKRLFIDIADGSETKTSINVWLGVTVCNQAEADEKIPVLLQTPVAHRFVSIEPMLGPVVSPNCGWLGCFCGKPAVDLIIVGGETGKNARPMHPDWVRSVRDQCQSAGVPFHVKQWGEKGE